MFGKSYQSLLESAQDTFNEARRNPKVRALVNEIKKNYRDNHKTWTREALDKRRLLEDRLEKDAYLRYSNDKPAGVSGLSEAQQREFVIYVKALAARALAVDVLVQGNEKTALSEQPQSVLDNAEAFRVLPKDFAQRHAARAKVGARLTVNVSKEHFSQLLQALTQLFNDDNRNWLHQAKIIGPKKLGTLTDQAVIYLSNPGVEHARTIGRQLGELLPATAFIEHTPVGMYRVAKGIAYSETAEGESSSHGQSRAKLIAAAGAQALLTDTTIDKTLPRLLQTRGYDVRDPALLAQAVLDRQLKGSLVPMSGGTEPREGSGDIQQFISDPVQFAQTHVLSAEALTKAGRLPSQGAAQLVKVAPDVYEIEYTDRPGAGASVPAYFLGYNGANQANAAPAYVDIAKEAAVGSFLFTGSLSGCSLIVTELDAQTYRVYHDGRVNSSLLYDHVVMAIDYKDYQVAGKAEGFAAAYMQYIDNQWQMVFQPQEYLREGQVVWPKLREGAQPLTIQSPDPKRLENNQAQFAAYREQVHQRLKKMAALFGVSVEGVADGVYTGGEFSPLHPAIAAWTRVRHQIAAKISADIDQLVLKRDELLAARRNASRSDLIEQQLKQISLTKAFYQAQYHPLLSEARSVDQTWLWQQIKAKDGMAVAVRTDDSAIQGGDDEPASTVAERYAVSEAYQRGSARSAAFFDGLRNYQDITIPGVSDTTSVLEMKRLFLEGSLTPMQKGALSGRIAEASQAEYIDKVLAQTAVFSEDFQGAGSTFNRLVPQDFYLSLVGDKAGGRCYPLVRAMAVALADNGEEGANHLVEKLFLAAADPDAGSSTLLKNSLIALHSNVEAVQASTVLGLFKLPDVVSRLTTASRTTLFALNTQRHSMMVGCVVGGEGRRYYFYDPNVGIFAFDTPQNLTRALNQHLVKRKLAAFYGALGSATAPNFDLVQIDAAQMAQVPLNRHLRVADLSRSAELADVLDTQRQMERVVDAQERVATDALLRTTLATFDAEQWGSKYHEASTRLALQAGLDQHWMPVIANTRQQADGRYEVQFINREQLQETRWVSTEDATFAGFRDFIDEHTSTLGEHFSLERGQLRARTASTDASPVDGLNSGFAVQALIRWFTDKARQDTASGTASPELALALKVHCYLNVAQMIHGGIQDVTKVIALVRTALRGEALAAETSLKTFVSSLGHTLSEGAGVVLGGALVILDAYELAHAENEGQKALYGTQLAFDAASFVVSAAGIGAGLLGAVAVGAVLSGAGVILGGMAIGITGLTLAFIQVAEDVKAVGRYFAALDAAYKGNGYRYDDKQKILVPLPGAVIKTLNLRQSQLEFDSQYLYRTHHGRTGSGHLNYFFWGGDFPTLVRDRNQAIEVRSGIGYERLHALSHSDTKTIILPGTVKSYISYGYIHFPGATGRHDPGFDVIRRLEQDYRFDYDFYIFPSEYTISRLHQEYVATPIQVLLDQHNRHLLVPELPKEIQGYLHYEIQGAGGEYLVALNKGVTVKLTDAHASAPSRWIIDSSALDNDQVSVTRNRLMIGGIAVSLDLPANARILVIGHKGEVREVDFARLSTQVVGEDASKWPVPGQSIEQHLHELAQTHQLNAHFVVVENYTHGTRQVGRGFYEVAKDRMLFTDTTQEQAKQATLGAVIDDQAYFYDADNAAVWRVTIASGQVNAQFEPWFNQTAGRISRLWQEGNTIYLVRTHLLADGSEAELGYRIQDDKMELVSVMGNDALLRFSARTRPRSHQVETLLEGYGINGTPRATPGYTLRSPLIKPVNAPLVTVYGNDAHGIAHRYWIRTQDGKVIKPNLQPPTDRALRFQAHEQTRSAWPIPTDLMLVGNLPRANAKEVFFFYSKEQNALFRQEGGGQAVLDANRPSALRIPTVPLVSVVDINGSVLVVTVDGLVAQLDAQGRFNYEAVNEHWLKGRPTWWQDLEAVNGKDATLAVFGLKSADGKSVLPTWYSNGQVVVASLALQNKTLQWLGLEDNGAAARLFEPRSGKLYRQPVMSPHALAAAFDADGVLKSSAQPPVARALAPELFLQEAEQVETGLRLATVKGEILLRTHNGDLHLIAVSKLWQKNNLSNLAPALAKLTAHWKTKGTVILQGSLVQGSLVQGWFDVASGEVFWRHAIAAADSLRFLGTEPGQKAAYVFSPTDETLYRVHAGGSVVIGRFANVERVGASLLLQGAGARNGDLSAPIMTGVNQVILHGGGGNDTYRLSKDMWQHYPTIVIDNEDPRHALDRLILTVGNPDLYLVSRSNNDLMLTYPQTQNVLVVRNVFSSPSAAHRHLQIEIEGTQLSVSVDQLVAEFTTVSPSSNVLFALSSVPKPSTAKR
ncbi:cytotoxin [Pseudomonas koreensis]|nr:TcdA/TcdB pore-forming domain-containing protein [Pseudomonas koreensis]MBP3997790.1 cytotoxin [Pseudomonas koreensis]MBP3998192.1 cytotoxin [Pseudomonas koreensis]MBP4000956.1 cytotoxin [Pseudomonas koreensis]